LARKILLADDSVTAQNMGRKILADAGYEVVTVNNGSAALKKIAELKPDLVILDVYMPGYSGLEVCQRLKESQDSSRIPVLLTVGKLEPFKPEEAQRVRAEGFIVKPFEASELLAALSKLEDKVVPRSEPSKPGRFARAIAAAEEAGRISRNDGAGEDNGWKSRISFPHEKTDEEKTADEAPIYNPVNRDLRTVVEAPAEKAPQNRRASDKKTQAQPQDDQPQEAPPQTVEATVDVAALASAGLPNDVTPEEVAAIAAAAAQIHIVAATANESHASASESSTIEQPVAEASKENIQAPPALEVSAPASQSEPVVAEAHTPVSQEVVPGETYATETSVGRETDKKSDDTQDAPMTMAAATESMAAVNGGTSHWSAVAVALEAEEANISLDQEMQKAYAAFVAEETASTNAIALPEVAPPEISSAPTPAAAEIEIEKEAPAPAIPTSEPEPVPHSEQTAARIESLQTEPPPVAQSQPADSFVAPLPEPAIVPEAATSASSSQLETVYVAPIPAEPVSATVEAAPVAQDLPPAPEPAVVEATASSNAFAPIIRAEPVPEPKEEQIKEQPTEEPAAADVKTTAAAWASWRQIRDTDSKPAAEPVHQELEVPAPVDSAAMAAAAGAEQPAQETAPENPGDVASIVDSVLADLRPRLMAEITRKMAEKK
jgi:CheY-like chemotaxis protein